MARQPRVQSLIKPLGIESAFQEEGPGLGPSSDLIRKFNQIRARYADPEYRAKLESRGYDPNEITRKGIADATEFDEKVREKELSGIFGFGSPVKDALKQIRKNQETDLFKSPEENLSALARRQLNKKFAEEIGNMPSDSPALQMSGLDQIAEELNRAEIPISGPKADELVRNEEKRKKDAEDFRAKEQALVDSQGGLRSQPIEGQGQENNPNEDASTTAFLSSMDEFINSARESAPYKPSERSIEEYKKAFAEATGIDISGKPDKSSALMALGLALMQNRAGSGFNVGNILRAVGQAGEVALPKLEAAQKEARANVIAAGKYALGAQAADRAADKANLEKSLNRTQYYIYKKGGEGTPFENFDSGDLSYLNAQELNELMKNPEFENNFAFIKGDDYFEIMKNEAKDKDLGDAYGKETSISLLGGDTEGVDSIYVVSGQRPDGNYKGKRKRFSYLQTDPESIVQNLIKEQQSILKEQEEFQGLIADIQTGVSIPKQIVSGVVTFGRNLGLNLGDGPTAIAQARKKLEKIQLLNATEILQESGKTLSDQDRIRVKDFVGTIDLASADEALILQSLGRVYDIILDGRQRNLDTARSNLKTEFGISFDNKDSSPVTEEELTIINEGRKSRGEPLLKMEDF